ncbi:ImmA/IrrE family metallo-endopeptidase [Veillonella sp.]|uniref:ImmA/IrrE family metallo-endopeptidase n=1 Tax=Veillonella sp. TaxID=1926307 RepID=UPI00280C1ED0|nr:ImmA/IrrE family metallo-endopeptidase [uncultured Veillonella sp.]
MNQPDYNHATKTAWRLLKDLQICSVPIDLRSIYMDLGIQLESFTEAESSPFATFIQKLRLKQIDGLCYKDGKRYIVFYEDKAQVNRIPFTLAHELGHILLGHHENSPNGFLPRFANTSSRDYREREADMFAGELIRSRPLLYLTNLTNPHDADIVSNIFGVSHLCATVGIEQIKRINFLTIPKTLKFFSNRFSSFINTKYCSKCSHLFVANTRSIEYCPVCGNKSLMWYHKNNYLINFFYGDVTGELPIMDYKTYPQNIDNGRTETCPRCELENIDSDWNYCPICSLPTQNVCEDCGEKLDPHFRYCPKCGKESLYFKEKALTSWKDEYDTQHSSPTTTEASSWDEDTIPF